MESVGGGEAAAGAGEGFAGAGGMVVGGVGRAMMGCFGGVDGEMEEFERVWSLGAGSR